MFYKRLARRYVILEWRALAYREAYEISRTLDEYITPALHAHCEVPMSLDHRHLKPILSTTLLLPEMRKGVTLVGTVILVLRGNLARSLHELWLRKR